MFGLFNKKQDHANNNDNNYINETKKLIKSGDLPISSSRTADKLIEKGVVTKENTKG